MLHAPAAYLSSYLQSQSLVSDILDHVPPSFDLRSVVTSLAEAAGKPEWLSVEDIDLPICQHPLSRAIDEACFSALVDSAPDVRSKALALSSAIKHAGDWLNVVPSPALGLHFQDQEFRLCLLYWLGVRMYEEGSRCPICLAASDPFGDHHVGCGGDGDRIYRHNSIRDAVFSAAQSAALAP